MADRGLFRWAGAKRHLLEKVAPLINGHRQATGGRLISLFFGSGAIERAVGGCAVAADASPELLGLYEDLQTAGPRSARFLWLSAMAFNGIWRVNSAGEMNMPPDPARLARGTEALPPLEAFQKFAQEIRAIAFVKGWENALRVARPGDLVFVDPPYGQFDGYTADGFGSRDHRLLARALREAFDLNCVGIIAFNAPEAAPIYHWAKCEEVTRSGCVSSKATERDPVTELVITAGLSVRNARILVGDVREALRRLPEASVHCVVTSPPYWGLRDYGLAAVGLGRPPGLHARWGDELKIHKGGPHGDGVMLEGGRSVIEAQALVKDRRAGAFCRCGAWRGCLGLEPTFDLYVEHMVEVFADVHRVLRPDGTLWLNLGDCYATGAGAVGDCPGGGEQGERWAGTGGSRGANRPSVNGRGEAQPASGIGPMTQPNRMPQPGLKAKDLVGIPWRVAFALQADGWWLRSDIVWSKPNPMPESITDRPTKAHEYLFLLTKSERYFYDKDAIPSPTNEASSAGRDAEGHRRARSAEPDDGWGLAARTGPDPGARSEQAQRLDHHDAAILRRALRGDAGGLVEPCILAGTSEKGACAKCGAPWERQTERESAQPPSPSTKAVCRMRKRRGGRWLHASRRPRAGGVARQPVPAARTTGWSPPATAASRRRAPASSSTPSVAAAPCPPSRSGSAARR
jgi:site-specific DNA-adenine methylase/DNA modification methylase